MSCATDAGLDRTTIKRRGMGIFDAYVQMYLWVMNRTADGYAPLLVSHNGFGFHFEMFQKELLRESEALGLHCPEGALDVPAEWRFLDTLVIAGAKEDWPCKRGKGLV